MPSSKSPLTFMSTSWSIDAMDKVSDAIVARSTSMRPREAPKELQEASAVSSPESQDRENKGETHQWLELFLRQRRNIEKSDDISFDPAVQHPPR